MNKLVIFRLVIIFTVVFCFAGCSFAVGEENIKLSFEEADFSYNKYTGVNPLKGFESWAGSSENSVPYSLEYIPLNLDIVMTAENTFDFTKVEEALENCKSSHHQAILRFILDEPNVTSHIPAYLLQKVSTFDYSADGNTGKTINYNDEYFLNQISGFIKKFAKLYDGDPRIALIQTGIIGHWGEQHIYYVENDSNLKNNENCLIKDSTWITFFKVWAESFKKTKLGARNPERPGHKNYSSIAYYNDMICSDEDNTYFDELLESVNANPESWKTSIVTGEIAPALQNGLITSIKTKNETAGMYKKFLRDVNKYHISSALFADFFEKNDSDLGANILEFQKAQSRMGYDLSVDAARVKANGKKVKMGVFVKNEGVAPFPYNWKVELAWYDGNQIIESFVTSWKISGLCDSSEMFTVETEKTGEAGAEYTLLMRIINPMAGGFPVKFSNVTQDSVVEGYITLGKIKF